jgi:hypothetical protein
VKKITVRLTAASIDAAIKELKRYKLDLSKKTQKLLDMMIGYGEDYAINAVGHVDTGETLESIHGYRSGNKGVIVAGGNAIWLEFGTGVTNNGAAGTSPHPEGQANGMLIGGYGNGGGADPNGWWYYDGDRVRHTYGIKANMFMYRTAQELARIAPELAKEVFAE